MNDFAKNLIEYREKAKLKQGQLASISGVSQQSISVYEKGERKPKYPTLSKLSKALKCHPDDLDPYYQYNDIHYQSPASNCPMTERCPVDFNITDNLYYIPAIKELSGLNEEHTFEVLTLIKKLKKEEERKKLGEEEGEYKANTA